MVRPRGGALLSAGMAPRAVAQAAWGGGVSAPFLVKSGLEHNGRYLDSIENPFRGAIRGERPGGGSGRAAGPREQAVRVLRRSPPPPQ